MAVHLRNVGRGKQPSVGIGDCSVPLHLGGLHCSSRGVTSALAGRIDRRRCSPFGLSPLFPSSEPGMQEAEGFSVVTPLCSLSYQWYPK